jgi:ribonuclease T1
MMRQVLALLLLACTFGLAQAQAIPRNELPPEAQETLRLISQGGPFPHRRDGIVFQNRERLLPDRPRGHYREYTVATPGVQHRGARRIVCGGERPRQPDACYYTADHYRSFRRIAP